MRMIFHLIALLGLKMAKKWPKTAKNCQNKQKCAVYAISSGITLVIGPKVGLNILCNDDNRNTMQRPITLQPSLNILI